jgi:hypothetical protein
LPIGQRALIIGAEHVSFSAVLTLRHAGAEIVGLTTELERHQSFAIAPLALRVPVWTRTRVEAIHGTSRVEEVELTDTAGGERRRVACDTVVFTGDWIPDHELAVAAGLELDPGTRGPAVDTGLRTARPGLFSAGNVLHGAEPADVAALSGRHAAAAVASWLDGEDWPTRTVPIMCRTPLHWVSPNAVSESRCEPPRGRFLLRSRQFLRRARVEIRQDKRFLWSGRIRRLVPGRSAELPPSWLESVDFDGSQIEIEVAG